MWRRRYGRAVGPLSLDVRLLSLPISVALTAAHDPVPDSNRLLTVVGITDDDGDTGWGECSALNRPAYHQETAEGVFGWLSTSPLHGAGADTGDRLVDHPMARAALEMAELDIRLKRTGISLASYLGVTRSEVPAGAVISLGSIDAALDAVAARVRQGFTRVKVKVVPAERAGFRPIELIRALEQKFTGLEVQADANGSFDRRSFDQAAELVGTGLAAFEQPFAPEELDLATELVGTGMCVVADEAATSREQVQRLIDTGACSAIAVKSSRLGGLFAAFELLGWCEEQEIPAAAGGMLESGLGRHALAAVAASDACTITGDVSPARSWLTDDPWQDLRMHDGVIDVPHAKGVCPAPDQEVLDRYTIRRHQRKVRIP